MFKTFSLPSNKDEDDERELSMFPEEQGFIGVIIGKPGSGKSWLIGQLLKHKDALYKRFDKVLFLSPHSIGDLDLHDDVKNDTLNIPWVYERIRFYKNRKKVSKVLVIIDDLISSVKKDERNMELIDFIYRRRHIVEGVQISILFTSQKYSMFPAKFRSNIDFLAFFNLPADDFKQIMNQQIFCNNPSLKYIIDQHFQKYKHNFVFIRLNPYALFLNLEKRIH